MGQCIFDNVNQGFIVKDIGVEHCSLRLFLAPGSLILRPCACATYCLLSVLPCSCVLLFSSCASPSPLMCSCSHLWQTVCFQCCPASMSLCFSSSASPAHVPVPVPVPENYILKDNQVQGMMGFHKNSVSLPCPCACARLSCQIALTLPCFTSVPVHLVVSSMRLICPTPGPVPSTAIACMAPRMCGEITGELSAMANKAKCNHAVLQLQVLEDGERKLAFKLLPTRVLQGAAKVGVVYIAESQVGCFPCRRCMC